MTKLILSRRKDENKVQMSRLKNNVTIQFFDVRDAYIKSKLNSSIWAKLLSIKILNIFSGLAKLLLEFILSLRHWTKFTESSSSKNLNQGKYSFIQKHECSETNSKNTNITYNNRFDSNDI